MDLRNSYPETGAGQTDTARTLRVLSVEDNEDETLLILHQLGRGGYQCRYTRVEDAASMAKALETQEWDVVISDHIMPHFNSLAALALLRLKGLDLPFIVVSGKISEEVLVEIMRAGAHDYLIKGRLARLVPVVEREIREAQVRRERARATLASQTSEQRFRLLAENSLDLICLHDAQGRYDYVSPSVVSLLGFQPEELIGRHPTEFLHSEDRDAAIFEPAKLAQGGTSASPRTFRMRTKAGNYRWFESLGRPITAGNSEPSGLLTTSRDITERREFEESIRQSERRFRVLFEQAPIGIGISLKGVMVDGNPAYMKMFGYDSVEELRGVPALNHYDLPYREEVSARLRRWEEGETDAYVYESVGLRKDGTRFPYVIHAAPMELPEGLARVGFNVDMTERKRVEQALRESEERYRSTMEATVTGIYVIQDFLFRYVNRAMAQCFGYQPEELIGASPLNLIAPEDREMVRQKLIERAKGKAGSPYEINCLRKDGSRFVGMVWGNAVTFEGKAASVGTLIDVTDRNRARTELIKAKEEAERASAAKTEFLARMSHELRTPLNAILGFAQLLDDDADHPLNESQKKGVQYVLKSGWHLLDLIDEVLDLSKIEHNSIQLFQENVDLKAVLRDCLGIIRPLADQRSVQIVTQCEQPWQTRWVYADPVRLKQIVLNLLSNAVKYNREMGVVAVDCIVADTGRLRVSVTDTGFGLSQDQQKQLFKPFSRLDSNKLEIPGLGVGLALAKKLVDLMDGEIGVDSVPGEGATFWFELPLGEGVPEAADPAPEPARKGSTLLYVEDNPVNLELVHHVLAKRRPDISLLAAHSAELGLELARRHRPDLVLLDINLPGMDGFEALQALRSSEATRDTPALAISADALPRDVERGLAAGFAAYLTKPIRVAELLEAIDAVLAPKAPAEQPIKGGQAIRQRIAGPGGER